MTNGMQSQRTCSRDLNLRRASVKFLLLAFMVTSALASPAQTFTTIAKIPSILRHRRGSLLCPNTGQEREYVRSGRLWWGRWLCI
jgi:hypothetical protein